MARQSDRGSIPITNESKAIKASILETLPAELQTMAQVWPERVDQIEALERRFTALRVERNSVKPGRYSHPQATFFQSRRADMQPQGIRELVDWSYTSRGGKQFDLFPGARGGCMSWGVCDLPPENANK